MHWYFIMLQPSTDVGRCGIVVDEYFDNRLRQLLPFVDIRATTPGSDQSDCSRSLVRGLKRRKLNCNTKSYKISPCDGDSASLDGMDKDELPSCDNTTT